MKKFLVIGLALAVVLGFGLLWYSTGDPVMALLSMIVLALGLVLLCEPIVHQRFLADVGVPFGDGEIFTRDEMDAADRILEERE